MILNLSKFFHFSRDSNEYKCSYVFKSNKDGAGTTDVRLVLNVSVNEKEEKLYELNKPTTVLFQSNDMIEKMIADEVIAFSISAKS